MSDLDDLGEVSDEWVGTGITALLQCVQYIFDTVLVDI